MWRLVCTGVLVLLAVTACDKPPGPEDLRDGPAARWSVPYTGGAGQRVAAVGDLILIPDAEAVRAVTRTTGADVWQHPAPKDYRFTIAGDLVLVQASKLGPLEVLDASTGTLRWRADEVPYESVIYRSAVYFFACDKPDGDRHCTITARDAHTGTPLWTVPTGSYTVNAEAIGVRKPFAPVAGPYVVAGVGADRQPYALLDPATGRPMAGRAHLDGWYQFAAGKLLVDMNNDPPRGDARCTVRLSAFDGATGAAAWTTDVFSGRDANDECARALAPSPTGLTVIGDGTRIAASTDGGRPQVFDLATGGSIWTGAAPGTPIDGDGRSLLVRDRADAGPLAVLDFATGAARWTAPDPGLSGHSASWSSAVTGGLVAVSGAKGDRPFVLVYAAADGRRLGRFPSWLAGAGDNWVAVSHSSRPGGTLVLDFIDVTPA